QTFEDIHGADSTVTLHLTINTPAHTALTATACETYTWTAGNGQTYTATGDYTYTHDDANGCTQVDTLHLTINHVSEGIDEQVACESYTWIDGTTYTASTNEPTFTLTNAAGCDSIVTLHLTINTPAHTALTATACESYTWTAGNGQTYTATGDYTYSHEDANGCTQVDTLHLTINHATEGIDEQEACETYTWIDGITYTASTNEPTFTLTNANGCDSIVTLHLTIFPSYNVTDAMTISASELPYVWNEVTFTEAGTQVATLQTVNGCDSVVTMTLTVTTTVDEYTITVNVSDLTPWGTVTGSGTFAYGSTDTLTATALENYIFLAWSDNNTDNPRMITVTQDSSFTAYFIPEEIVIPVNDSVMGSVDVDIQGNVDLNTLVVITAIPEPHYHFVSWSDNNTENPRTVTLLQSLQLTAIFAIDQHTITVLSANGAMGTVSPSGTYDYGTEIFISAEAYPGYQFVSWNDGNTENPRAIIVEQDSTFIATFQVDDGINESDLSNVTIYSYADQVVVLNAEGQSVEIFDMSGRMVVRESTVSQSECRYTIFAPGIYLVKVGENVVKKVTILTR
ncbi:MAG: T9SS type A sorting domain-containing protein, partial [Bacteroidales bacterium]|nr:T9SS type A sorting domain-containing protein [Bacteroidales bacterium]